MFEFDSIIHYLLLYILVLDSKWQSRRKLLTPTFHLKILKQFTEILIKESKSMTRSLESAGDVITKDLIPFISEHTLNIICETAMGTSFQGISSLQQQYRKAVHRVGELLVYRNNDEQQAMTGHIMDVGTISSSECLSPNRFLKSQTKVLKY
ncbi:cytochrome P450 4C1-like isoform X2 [Monomorium pharaonis]|uniref:cytochrome P450 4C1-like isoform X2 n=1 Tax=Monomorium pharaonis TaxID=307658 RepID=UPI001745EB6E|nr:cytochrome P450 4C1-like isoform X2 [Monomorium pharaonis]